MFDEFWWDSEGNISKTRISSRITNEALNWTMPKTF